MNTDEETMSALKEQRKTKANSGREKGYDPCSASVGRL